MLLSEPSSISFYAWKLDIPQAGWSSGPGDTVAADVIPSVATTPLDVLSLPIVHNITGKHN